MTGNRQSAAEMLAEFHAAFGQPLGHGSLANSALRRQLHTEEHHELIEALDARDLVAVAQELADVVYVAYGTAHSLGIPLDEVLAEVHRANTSKFGPDSRPVLREDGKVMKSAEFVPADVATVLAAHRDDQRHAAVMATYSAADTPHWSDHDGEPPEPDWMRR